MAIANLDQDQLKQLDQTKLVGIVDEMHATITKSGAQYAMDPKYCKNWALWRLLLVLIKTFTPDATDKKIDQIIAVGDTFCPTVKGEPH